MACALIQCKDNFACICCGLAALCVTLLYQGIGKWKEVQESLSLSIWNCSCVLWSYCLAILLRYVFRKPASWIFSKCLRSTFLLDVTPCSLVQSYWPVGGTCSLHVYIGRVLVWSLRRWHSSYSLLWAPQISHSENLLAVFIAITMQSWREGKCETLCMKCSKCNSSLVFRYHPVRFILKLSSRLCLFLTKNLCLHFSCMSCMLCVTPISPLLVLALLIITDALAGQILNEVQTETLWPSSLDVRHGTVTFTA